MVPAYVGSARPATANLFLQYLWKCNWFALELSYPIGLDLHSKECWCMLCARFTRTPFRSDTGQNGSLVHRCQIGSASTMEKIPRVGIKLLYLKPDWSNRYFLHSRHFSTSTAQHVFTYCTTKRMSNVGWQ